VPRRGTRPNPSEAAADDRRGARTRCAPTADKRSLDSSITPLIRLLTLGGRIFGRAVTRVSIEGALDDLPGDGPLIIAANHASNLDVPIIGAWLIPRLGRRIHWLGKKELFDWPIVGWVAANSGVHPVDRGAADVEAFRLAQRILDEGNVLFVFPEGTRSPDGVLQEARDGIALLAMPLNSFLGLVLFVTPVVLYEHYATLQRIWGPTPLEDQQLAGGIMWAAGDLIFLVPLVVLTLAWFRAEEEKGRLHDEKLDRELARLARAGD
jgi:1-acyl-sn-glycerol-3-phosphate acyltransferase